MKKYITIILILIFVLGLTGCSSTKNAPVKMDVEKGAWFKIGVAIQNPSDCDIVVEVQVENTDIKIE